MIRVALFTHNFLEPTHHAIAAVLDSQKNCEYHVFAKRRMPIVGYRLPNVKSCCTEEPESGALASFDLVHAIYDGKTALKAAKKASAAGVPFLLSFHGGFDTNAKIHDTRYRDWTRRATEFAAAVTVPSVRDLAHLRAIGAVCDVNVMPVPVDFRRLRMRRAEVGGHLVVLARLIEKKGVDTAILALRQLPADYTLRVIGDGPMREALQSMARGLEDRVVFLGTLPLKDALRELASAEALVYPCRVAADGNADGVPQAILWAMALRVPVVAADAGGVRSLVGDRGLLVPADNPVDFASATVSLRTDAGAARTRCDRAFDYVRNVHDLCAVASRWDNLYRQTAAGGPR